MSQRSAEHHMLFSSSLIYVASADLPGKAASGLAASPSRKGRLRIICCGGDGGWVRFLFDWGGSGATKAVLLNYSHGYGGGGPGTKGVILTNRRATYLPDAHLVVSGHIHERWTLDLQRVRINSGGKVYHDTQTHVVVPTYKEEYGDGYGGWHVERGAPPKPTGAAWLRFHWSPKTHRVRYDVTWAQ